MCSNTVNAFGLQCEPDPILLTGLTHQRSHYIGALGEVAKWGIHLRSVLLSAEQRPPKPRWSTSGISCRCTITTATCLMPLQRTLSSKPRQHVKRLKPRLDCQHFSLLLLCTEQGLSRLKMPGQPVSRAYPHRHRCTRPGRCSTWTTTSSRGASRISWSRVMGRTATSSWKSASACFRYMSVRHAAFLSFATLYASFGSKFCRSRGSCG